MEETVLNYFKTSPNREIDYVEICYSLSTIDENVFIALRSLIKKKKLCLIKDETRGWRKLFVCRLAGAEI